MSAEDVILSTKGLKDFAFTPAEESEDGGAIVAIGSGFDWGEVDAHMEEKANGYQVVGARCSWVRLSDA